MDKAFAARLPQMQACMQPAYERLDVLSGKMSYTIRVLEDGHAKYAHFTESTLGDREAEKCILNVFLKAEWPKSLDGDGVAKHSSSFDQDVGSKVESWAPDRVMPVLKKAKKLAKCTHGAKGTWSVTAYIGKEMVDAKDPSEGKVPGKDGKFISGGGGYSSPDGGDVLDCVLAEMADLKFPAPSADYAKVTFSYPF